MDRYEVIDIFEAGDAGDLIQTPKITGMDEVSGFLCDPWREQDDE